MHTWGQNLSLHPHIHCLVPSAGLTLRGELKRITKQGKFLYPEKMLGKVFRGKLLGKLKRHLSELGQYTHRVAISNQRIQQIDKEGVSFHMKDYADQGKRKLTNLSGVEFLHRFSLHILPRRFVRIRYLALKCVETPK